MNIKEHLLTIIAEESTEIAKDALKSLRFGAENSYPEGDKSNAEKLFIEFIELAAAIELLAQEDDFFKEIFKKFEDELGTEVYNKKKYRIEEYLIHSCKLGTLTDYMLPEENDK